MNKKVLSLAIATFVLCGSTTLFSNTTKAETLNRTNTIVATMVITPNTAGVVVVTSTSGANLRSGAGTSYSIVGTAYYGEELAYKNITKKDTSGVNWYYVTNMSGTKTGWISSTVGRLG